MEANKEEEGDRQPEIQDKFADPDPYDAFPFTFQVSRTSYDDEEDNCPRRQWGRNGHDNGEQEEEDEYDEEITITLHGIKAENRKLPNSTGLTLWRSSSLLCDLLFATPKLS